MRLIDADAIKFEEDCTFSGKGLNEFVKKIPTAYDVDKVVERLKELHETISCDDWYAAGKIYEAIEIAKSGMKE